MVDQEESLSEDNWSKRTPKVEMEFDDSPEQITYSDFEFSDDELTEKLSNSAPMTSALSSFQKIADRFPPLAPLEQNAYASRYQASLILREGYKNNEYKGREKKKVEEELYQASKIMEHLCASCWRLAWMIVREQAEKRFGKERAKPLLPDLMAEANTALVESVLKFDPARIPMFHTYAAQCVRDHMRAVLSRDTYLQLAPSWNRLKRIAVARLPELISELGRNPSKEELQADLLQRCLIWADEHLTPEQKKLPKGQQHELKMAKLRKQGMIGALRDIDQVLIATQNVTSLDTPIGDESGGASLGDLVISTNNVADFQAIEHVELSRNIEKALGFLTQRERDILIYRYGLGGVEELRYNQIAEKFEISSERVRQIERSALAKLASPQGQFASLAEFLPSRLDGELEAKGF